jgi:hypothetical protein
MGNIWVSIGFPGQYVLSRSLLDPETWMEKIRAGKLLAKTTANPVAFWLNKNKQN